MAPKRKRASETDDAKPIEGETISLTMPSLAGIKAEEASDSPLSDAPENAATTTKTKGRKGKPSTKIAEDKGDVVMPAKSREDVDALRDPEADEDEPVDEEEVMQALSRPPPVNSDYLPLPWKGRLGYACLNTYLRYSNPPIFCSRTCRIASILEHRHPLQDPSQPEHATKNRPDRTQPADIERGRKYVEEICLANVRDIAKMIRWNDKYNIKFLRLSSEMFPFASHEEYGYKLEPFAGEALAEAGKVIAELGHRVTTHPGQFTQLGSPRKSVTENAKRDLEYHDEMLSLLKLPEQLNRDAVMIVHMGGVFGDKPATIERFKEVYATLSHSVKNRLVLENDDVSYSVHELLPVCEELNIPMVLDYHHHNILFDSEQIREGTKDIIDLYPRILATWSRKNITPKMHYSEQRSEAITARQRRKHRPRVQTLPPCPDTMDLMIEAKDKEQAVFELMRNFRLPGHNKINELIPYVRNDDNKLALQEQQKRERKSTTKKPKKKVIKNEDGVEEPAVEEEEAPIEFVSEEDIAMGGPDGRVYWPSEMEEWLRPKKREVKPRATNVTETPAKKKLKAESATDESAVGEDDPGTESDLNATPATKKAKALLKLRDKVKAELAKEKETKSKGKGKGKASEGVVAVPDLGNAPATNGGKKASANKAKSKGKSKVKKEVEEELESSDDASEADVGADDEPDDLNGKANGRAGRKSGRAKKNVSYAENGDDMDVD